MGETRERTRQTGPGPTLSLALLAPGVCCEFVFKHECSFSSQTITEKHKLNVPETMTEVLDVSDEEGEACSAFSVASVWSCREAVPSSGLSRAVRVGTSGFTINSRVHLSFNTLSLAIWEGGFR